ncbi:hypothetical protein KC331_g8098 [Hortaea werneckii]|nr:hypothetical protein KC331_g8098 [Hortaea werneckii]KAI7713455.1 hypothetical protein KC353_g7543 [Hortaea werneckii]
MGQKAVAELEAVSPIVDQFSLLQIDDGTQDVPESISLWYGHKETGAHLRHVTNGTHGFVQSLGASGSARAKKRVTFSWGNQVFGLKFSYHSPCANNNFYINSAEGQALRYAMYNWAYWTAYTVTADKYIMEFSNPANHDATYAVGTMIAEGSGYGNNYEGWPYEAQYGC